MFFTCSWFVCSPRHSAAQENTDNRALRVERWLKAVLGHEPGAADEAMVDVGLWSNDDLQTLWVDATVFARLMRDPKISGFNLLLPGQRKPQLILYPGGQLRRLKVLACAAGGKLNEPVCMQLAATSEIDADLRRLADLASRSRLGGDDNYVLRRGAMLHADLAMRSSDIVESVNGAPAGLQRVVLTVSDGRQVALGQAGIHWEMGRLLLDHVSPAPERDTMVRLWYRATTAWMQSRDYYDPTHLGRARQLFPNDADILFLSGCEREAFGRAATQSAVRAASLPAGFVLDIGSDSHELGEAERFFRRALGRMRDHTEARLRLGRVLLVRGRYKEAADELRTAAASADDDLLRYYGGLFLGTAEEALGNYDSAGASYARAAELYPDAQSSYLASSAMARRRGDRSGALKEIQRVFELPSPDERQDPWWTYHVAQGRNADQLFDELCRPFLETLQ